MLKKTWPACHHCARTDVETRPYGPKGASVCFPCGTATPERAAEAVRQFKGVLDAADAAGVSVVLTNDGPRMPTKGDA